MSTESETDTSSHPAIWTSFVQENWQERSCKQVLKSICRLVLFLMVWGVAMSGFFATFVWLTRESDHTSPARLITSGTVSMLVLVASIVFVKLLTAGVASRRENESFFIFGDGDDFEIEDSDAIGPLLLDSERTTDL